MKRGRRKMWIYISKHYHIKTKDRVGKREERRKRKIYVVKNPRWRLSDKSAKISHNFPCCYFVSPPLQSFTSFFFITVSRTRKAALGREEKMAWLWVLGKNILKDALVPESKCYEFIFLNVSFKASRNLSLFIKDLCFT